jgi:hypothetical protein
MPKTPDTDLLEAALLGYQQKLKETESRIAELRRMLHGTPASTPAAASAPVARKRKLSAKGRANIIAALKKRWAAKKAAIAPAPPKPAAKKTAVKKAARKTPAKAKPARKAAAKVSAPPATPAPTA